MSQTIRLLAFMGWVSIGVGATGFAQTRGLGSQVTNSPPTTETYRCSKCGRLHTRTVAAPASTTRQTGTVTRQTGTVTRQTGTVTRQAPPTVRQPVSSATGQTAKTAPPKTGSATATKAIVTKTSTEIPMASSSQLRSTGGIVNVLAELNAQRSRSGVPPLRPDPALQLVAQRRARLMAAQGLKGHPPGSFAPGRYEGVGWSSTYSPSKVSACYTGDSRMRYAGAAMATGRDGVYFAVVYR